MAALQENSLFPHHAELKGDAEALMKKRQPAEELRGWLARLALEGVVDPTAWCLAEMVLLDEASGQRQATLLVQDLVDHGREGQIGAYSALVAAAGDDGDKPLHKPTCRVTSTPAF